MVKKTSVAVVLATSALVVAGCAQLIGLKDDYQLDSGLPDGSGSVEGLDATADQMARGEAAADQKATPVDANFVDADATIQGTDGKTDAGDARVADAADAAALDGPVDGSVDGARDTGTDAIADAPTDAVVVVDAAPPLWGNFTDPTRWESVSAGIATGVPGNGQFQGATFDGRYINFGPGGLTGTFARFDTTQPFTLGSSWGTLNLASIDTRAQGDAQAVAFSGAVFDGRYVYLIPSYQQPLPEELLVRCDTSATGGCLSPASWSAFALGNIDDAGTSYRSAVYTGRYVTLVPFDQAATGQVSTRLAQFDTQAAGGIAAGASWNTFQINLVVNGAYFGGGIFDGRHLYFIPAYGDTTIAIYDTTLALDDSNAWSGLTMSTVSDGGSLWIGGAFDGRYMYLSPSFFGSPAADALRCDTSSDGGCTSPASWSQFNVAALDAGYPASPQYFGAAFDGRYVYYAPYVGTNIALREDTTGSFTDPSSWTSFDLSTLNPGAPIGFWGAVFDGEYIYYVPSGGMYFLRFNARQPAAPPGPPTYGSFY